MINSVLLKQIPYERFIQCQILATFSVLVAVEDCLERSLSTDIPSVLETLKPFLGLRLDCCIITNCSLGVLCVSEAVLPSFKQNLMQIFRSFTSAILACRYDRKTTPT
jgi:hypothetical protein